MDFEQVVYFAVAVLGGGLVWMLFRSRWPGWLGFPLALLTIQATRDLGVAPLTFSLLNYQYSNDLLFTRVHGEEALQAAGLILLCYASIALGLIAVRATSRHIRPSITRVDMLQNYPPQIVERGWRVSIIFFVVGVVANLVTLAYLLPERTLSDLALERAVFSDEAALTDPLYGYMRLLAPLMQYGALGMVLFSFGRHPRFQIGVGANLAYIVLETLYGGRARVVIGLACLLLAYHYGIRPVRWRDLWRYLVIALIALATLSLLRFRPDSFSEIPLIVLRSALASDFSRIDETAWILRVFPAVVPYTGWLNAVGAIARFIPRLQVPNTNTLYGYVVQYFYGGINPMSGVGGANYATAAELYSWGGYGAVVVFGFFAGLLFGGLFEWQRRSPANIFLKLLTIVVLMWSFFLGLQARLPVSAGSAGFYLVPIALMAALTVRGRRNALLILLLYFDLTAFVAWRFLGSLYDVSLLRLIILASVPLVYLLGVRALDDARPHGQDARTREVATQLPYPTLAYTAENTSPLSSSVPRKLKAQ